MTEGYIYWTNTYLNCSVLKSRSPPGKRHDCKDEVMITVCSSWHLSESCNKWNNTDHPQISKILQHQNRSNTTRNLHVLFHSSRAICASMCLDVIYHLLRPEIKTWYSSKKIAPQISNLIIFCWPNECVKLEQNYA